MHAAAVEGGRSYADAAAEHQQRELERKRKLEQLEELERKVQKRKEKKQRKKEERRHKREKKRRKRHISKHGAPLVRALRDLQPSMAGETVIAVGRIVDEGEPVPALPAKTEHHHRPPAADHDDDEGLDELSAEAIARRKMKKKALERAISSGGGEREEAESVRRWEEEERRRRQAECWRTLPALNRNQDRFRLAKDGRDVILEFDRRQEDTFLPDNTDLWVWGTLEARIVPLSELCMWRDVAGTIPLAEEVPVFVVHLAKWKLASECTDSSE